MIALDFPPPVFRIRRDQTPPTIFDPFRKKWVVLTPEEWVRQNMLQYLTQIKKYPSSLVAVEREIAAGSRRQRYDILVFGNDAQPWMLVECKAVDIAIDQRVIDQVLRYNLYMPARFLVVTNGSVCFGFERQATGLVELDAMPEWDMQ